MKSFLRFLQRNKLYSFIEIFGLSVAIGFTILLTSYAQTEYKIGADQPRAKEIYAVGTGEFIGMTLETIPHFAPSIPEIAEWCRMEGELSGDVIIGENVFPAKGIAVDSNFYSFFDYRVTGCDRKAVLCSRKEIMLSESFARKAFGNENPVGQNISFSGRETFVVSGTFEDFGPYDLFEDVDFMFSIKNSVNQPMDQFGTIQTFVTLTEGCDPEAVNQKLLTKYAEYWVWFGQDASKGSMLWGSSLTRFDQLFFSKLSKSEPMRSGNSRQVNLLLMVGLVLLISAIFNYVNLTVAQTGKRAKEMATRRLLGSSSATIVLRYLRESALFTFGCFAIGLLLAYYFRPLFNRILQADITFAYNALSISLMVGTLVLISLIAGLMPAFLASKYKPIDVVKGNFAFQNKMRLGRIFIMIQTLISVVFTTMAIVMMAQVHHLSTLPMGYRSKDLICIEIRSIRNASQKSVLRDRLLDLPQIKRASLSGQLPFLCGFNGVPMEDGSMVFLAMPTVDTTAFQMLEFNVLEQYSDPVPPKIWLTRDAQAVFNIDANHPKIGTDSRFEVCGIIDNYHVRDAIFEPMINGYNAIQMWDDSQPWHFYILLEAEGDKDAVMAALREQCNQTVKELTGHPKQLPMYYLEDYLYDQIKGKRNTMSLVLSFMIVALLISALGMFAMSVYYTEQQARQIAVRKVYGSTTEEVTARLSQRFLILAGVAVLLSIPLSIYLIRLYLQGFANRIDFPVGAIIAASLFALLIAFVSVFGRSRAAASRNPVDTLKKE